MLRAFFSLLLIAAVGLLPAQSPEPVGPAKPQFPIIRFESKPAIQFEVWIDGRRIGFMPCAAPLPPGKRFLAAFADGTRPIIQEVDFGASNQTVTVTAIPLRKDNHQEAGKEMVGWLKARPKNPELQLALLQLSTDAEDSKKLLENLDRDLPRDPMVDVSRAKWLLRQAKKGEALATATGAADRAPNVSFAWRTKAEALRELGKHAEALEAANQAVIYEPAGWRALRVRAKIHEAAGNARAAQQDAERADELYRAASKAAGLPE